jgi:hypothetical protein
MLRVSCHLVVVHSWPCMSSMSRHHDMAGAECACCGACMHGTLSTVATCQTSSNPAFAVFLSSRDCMPCIQSHQVPIVQQQIQVYSICVAALEGVHVCLVTLCRVECGPCCQRVSCWHASCSSLGGKGKPCGAFLLPASNVAFQRQPCIGIGICKHFDDIASMPALPQD